MRGTPNPENLDDMNTWKTSALLSLKNTKFVTGDYGTQEGTPGSFDTITCLSVSKWIHFHHGDDGIKFVFKKFFSVIRPGGHLVLEPQDWSSYQQAKRKQVCGFLSASVTHVVLVWCMSPVLERLDFVIETSNFCHLIAFTFTATAHSDKSSGSEKSEINISMHTIIQAYLEGPCLIFLANNVCLCAPVDCFQDMHGVTYGDLKLLKFKPDKFISYLIEIGFHQEESILVPTSSEGFSRPIYVLRRP